MAFAWFVAKRYLRSPKRPAVLRLVTGFSVLGVTAGVATLVVALAMNTGFRETLQDRIWCAGGGNHPVPRRRLVATQARFVHRRQFRHQRRSGA